MSATKISWKKLKCHRGSALDVPKWIEKFLESREPSEAEGELSGRLMHPHKWKKGILPPEERWVEASAPAIDLFLASVEAAKRPEWVLGHVADWAGGLHEDGWLGSPESYLPGDIAEVLRKNLPLLTRLATHDSPAVRAAAILVLALLPSSESEALRRIFRAALESDVEANVRVGALLALARHAEKEDAATIERYLNDESAPTALRGAATLATLRSTPTRSIDELRGGIECWLSLPFSSEPATPLAWFGSGLERPIRSHLSRGLVDAAWSLHQLAIRWDSYERWRPTLLRIGLETHEPRVRRAVSDLLELHDFPQKEGRPAPATKEELSELQLDILRTIGDKMLMVAPCGIPAAGPVRLRHFGWAPPSVMETPVTITTKEGIEHKTFATAEGRNGRPYLPEVLALPAAQRWRVFTELSVSLFFPTGIRIIEEELAELLDQASADPKIVEVAPPVIDEIAHWYVEARAQDAYQEMWGEVAELILVPAVRAGVPFQKAWLCLLPDQLPLSGARALIGAMPAEMREDWLMAHRQYFEIITESIDLVPGSALARYYWTRIRGYRRDGEVEDDVLALEARIRELAETDERFAQAIREADAELEATADASPAAP